MTCIETSPGPPIHSIDPTQTIKAPYSQGDVMYFGENAGKQCVAMSLSALIYNKIKGIHTYIHTNFINPSLMRLFRVK